MHFAVERLKIFYIQGKLLTRHGTFQSTVHTACTLPVTVTVVDGPTWPPPWPFRRLVVRKQLFRCEEPPRGKEGEPQPQAGSKRPGKVNFLLGFSGRAGMKQVKIRTAPKTQAFLACCALTSPFLCVGHSALTVALVTLPQCLFEDILLRISSYS